MIRSNVQPDLALPVSPAPRENYAPETWFGVPVWSRAVIDHTALNAGLLEAVERLESETPSIHRSNVGGWHSTADLHRHADFTPLRRIVERASLGCARHLGFDFDKADLVFQGMWANSNGPGDYNKSHIHPNAFLSGTYYVKVPPESGNIEFYDPVRERAMYAFPTKPEAVARKKIEYKCRNGLLLIFPSWLSHSVQANRSNDTRISIAFNIEVAPKRGPRPL